MANFYVSGLMSGLDTNNLISQLMSIERRPLNTLLNNISSAKRLKDVFGELNTALLALKDAAAKAGTAAAFSGLKAVSSDASLLGASAGSAASAGTYTFTVVHALTRGLDASNAFADADSTTGEGTLVFFVGGEEAGQVELTDTDTYASVVEKINAAGLGLTASMISADGGYRILVEAPDSGAASDVEITSTAGDLSFVTVTEGRDAEIRYGQTNPLTFTSTTNTFENVLPGITVTVNAQPAAPTAVAVNVSRDTEAAAAAVENLVNKYNEVVKTVNKYSTYDADSNRKGLLFGDLTVRMMMQDLSGIMTGTAGAGDYNSLMMVGVSVDRQGLLALDKSAFEAALAAAETDVTALFTDATEGIAARLDERLGFLTAFGSGVLYNRQNSLDERITLMESRAESMETSLARREAMYRKQFTAMEEALAMLESQSLFLSQHFSALNSLTGSK
ncbi:MAG TPA: hypothetical protein ENN09_01840 [Planctomycetes bacterium]|nr:hypothetical protein [Planctomycetota bacterium]